MTKEIKENLNFPVSEEKVEKKGDVLDTNIADISEIKEKVAEIKKKVAEIKATEKPKSKLEPEPIIEEKIEVEERKDTKKDKKPEVVKEIDIKVIKDFGEFNIIKEDLEKIEGFNKLSKGQQLLILENLRQLTLGRIQEEASEKYKKDTAETNFLGRIWQAVSKKYQIAKLEKTTAKEIQKGGINIHKKVLQQLVKGIKETGLEVVEKDKELEIQYISGLENLTEDEQKKVEGFNKIATEYSKIPYEWSLGTATKKEQKEYKKLKQEYEKVKGDILELMHKKNEDFQKENPQKEASLFLNAVDGKVHLNQFLNTHPEVEKQLQKIEDKNTWLQLIPNLISKKGLFFVTGAIIRSVSASLFGLGGVALVSGVINRQLIKRRAKETLTEKEKMARKGVKDISKEAKNFVDADNLTKKLEFLIQEIDETNSKINNVKTDAGLIAELIIKKEKLINSLNVRIDYTKEKINDGLVNFGAKEERLINQFNIIQVLSRAMINVGGNNKEIKTELEKRLERFLNFKKEKISKAQKEYITNQALRGALLGAGFASAGWLFKHWTPEEWWEWKKNLKLPEIKLPHKIEEIFEEIKSIIYNTGQMKEQIKETIGTSTDAGQMKETLGSTLKPESKPFEVAEEIKIERGDSIWSISKKYLEGNETFQKLIKSANPKTAEALETYNIDRMKDTIVADPEKFGLPKDVDFTKLSAEQLKGIDWQKAFNETFPEGKGLTQSLSNEQIDSIIKNNETLREFFAAHPDAPRTIENYEDILKGKGITGEEISEVPPPEIVKEEEIPSPEIVKEERIEEIGSEISGEDKVPLPEIVAEQGKPSTATDAAAEQAAAAADVGKEKISVLSEQELVDLNIKLEQEVNDIGREIARKTWFSGPENWEFYKKQNVQQLLEYCRFKKQGILYKWWHDVEGKNILPWRVSDAMGEEKFRINLGEKIFSKEMIKGIENLSETDKKLSIFEYMKKIYKKYE